jgi:solute carrier family 24 (sodium/potassium/calcium exchanger), member 6
VFLTTVVVAAVCMVGPFHAMERPFLRDIIFYMITVFFTFCVCYDGQITLLEASGIHTFAQ